MTPKTPKIYRLTCHWCGHQEHTTIRKAGLEGKRKVTGRQLREAMGWEYLDGYAWCGRCNGGKERIKLNNRPTEESGPWKT